jgi:hypothetical protein
MHHRLCLFLLKTEADLVRCYRTASSSVAGAMGPFRSLSLAVVWLWVRAPQWRVHTNLPGARKGVWVFSGGSFWG